MAQLRARFRTILTGASVRTIRATPTRWYEIQITPEITLDTSLDGCAILPEDLRKLREGLRAQHATLKGLLSRR